MNWLSTEPFNYEVDPIFQNLVDTYFKPITYRAIRKQLNVMTIVADNGTVDMDGIYRVANLCGWAKEQGLYLHIILGAVGGYDEGEIDAYESKVYKFVYALVTTLAPTDPDAYCRIQSYQVENEMNHYYWHPDWSEQDELELLVRGSIAIRQAELDAFQNYNIDLEPTPLTINFSYDIEYATGNAYTKMVSYCGHVCDHGVVDIIGLDWYPGTWTTGSSANFPDVVRWLCDDFNAYVLVTETGMSTGKVGNDEQSQKDYYSDVTWRLLRYYYLEGGRENGFLGILWYQMFDDANDDTTDPIMSIERNFGIIDTDGGSDGDGGNVHQKAVWYWLLESLMPATSWLGKMVYVNSQEPSSAPHGTMITDGSYHWNDTTVVLWSYANNSSSDQWCKRTDTVIVFQYFRELVIDWNLSMYLQTDYDDFGSWLVNVSIALLLPSGNWHIVPLHTINEAEGNWSPISADSSAWFYWTSSEHISAHNFDAEEFIAIQFRLLGGVKSLVAGNQTGSDPDCWVQFSALLNIPPCARAGEDLELFIQPRASPGLITLDGSASYDLDGTISAYYWDLDATDGLQVDLTGVTPSFEVPIGGTYIITLTVIDTLGDASTDTLELHVLPLGIVPIADAGEDQVVNGFEVTFDATSSTNPYGDPMVYLWDFDANDGIAVDATGLTPTWTYATYGTYLVTLTVIWVNNYNASATDTCMVTINAPPIADLGIMQARTVYTYETIEFNSYSIDPDGYITTTYWDFGDGDTASGTTVTHMYKDDGIYEVILTVVDNHGATAEATVVVTVKNRPPVANITANRTFANPQEPIAFTSYSYDPDGYIQSYFWEFGDSTNVSTTKASSVVHSYSEPGNYTVTLTVTDDNNAVAHTNLTVVIKPLLEAGIEVSDTTAITPTTGSPPTDAEVPETETTVIPATDLDKDDYIAGDTTTKDSAVTGFWQLSLILVIVIMVALIIFCSFIVYRYYIARHK
jgi:PKD repeat protein